MISANEAKAITSTVWEERQRTDYAWRCLDHMIKKESKIGRTNVWFCETFKCRFHEDRKEVKQKLEALGYKVKYRKINEIEYDYDINLYEYFISWEE